MKSVQIQIRSHEKLLGGKQRVFTFAAKVVATPSHEALMMHLGVDGAL
ncbi:MULTISPECIES: hypothetical protein [unclassified Paenibacillus]|nr:hypothetical protein [Paenibacillus sp. RC343]